MKIAYFDCFSGVSGDMALGALLACEGADEAAFRAQLAGLNVPGYELKIERVRREGISAIDVTVRLKEREQGHGRHLSDITHILGESDLPDRARERSLAIFTRLADAEAKIHGVDREAIHFHEVGAVDAIVDIAGACILLEMLGIDQIATSAFPCGHGTVNCEHGIMPLPAPATMELLKGFSAYDVDIEGELVTPTGAAIVTTLADPASAGRLPAMRVLATGFGAGKKQFKKDMPNLLRVIIGERDDTLVPGERQAVCVLETNIDDERPEVLGYAMERCLLAGAWDVFFAPITMKKSRPGVLLSVLCPPELSDTMAQILFRETGTFGIRIREQQRRILAREWRTVTTPYGDIRIKIGSLNGDRITASPEYEDCRRAAEAHAVPLKLVYEAAVAAYRAACGSN